MDSGEILIHHGDAAFKFPISIRLAERIQHLGDIPARRYAIYKAHLLRGFGEDISKVVAFSNALYRLSNFALHSEQPSKYSDSAFIESIDVMHSDAPVFPCLNRGQLLKDFSIDAWPGYLTVMCALACLFFEQADAFAAKGRPVPDVIRLVCEATRAVEIAREYEAYERGKEAGFENAQEEPRFWEALESERGRRAIEARHAKPGGANERHTKIKKIWASGKYASRDCCAEQEYESLGFGSFKSARNALKGTQDPAPWPGRKN